MTIYRGFDIEHDGQGNYAIKREGVIKTIVTSEDKAYLWIDGEKAIEHKKQ